MRYDPYNGMPNYQRFGGLNLPEIDGMALFQILCCVGAICIIGYNCTQNAGRKLQMTCGDNHRLMAPGYFTEDYAIQEWATWTTYDEDFGWESHEGWQNVSEDHYKTREEGEQRCKQYRNGERLR